MLQWFVFILIGLPIQIAVYILYPLVYFLWLVLVSSPIHSKPQTQTEKDLKSIARGSKPFEVYLKDGTFLGRWTNKSDCSKKLNISRSVIIRALKIKTHNYNSKYIIKEVVDA